MDAKVILGGRYELQSRLGEGGMATVYMALDRKLDRKVAVKVLHSHMEKNDEIRHRFHQEAKTISSLNHPNILKIYDFSGVSSKKLWIVTEIIHGNSLGEYIQKFTSGSLHPIIAAAIVRETAKALSAAHERGVIHRDIKPENIMLTEKGKVKLMDFGISKDLRDHSVTQTGTFMGSPSYMSPEQVVSGSLDTRTDTYSLGIVFYEILTGRLPFRASTTSELTKKIRAGDFVEPKYLRPQLQDELNELICDCMSTTKDDRPEEVSFVAQQIEHFLARLGFVESHVELERFFKDRVSFEARLRAVESEQALQSRNARSISRSNSFAPVNNRAKTAYIRAKANSLRHRESQTHKNSHGGGPSSQHPTQNTAYEHIESTKYQNAVQDGSIVKPPQHHVSNQIAMQKAAQRRAYQVEMQKRAALARSQRMKAYKRAVEAQAYRRTQNVADANALWNGVIALVVFALLGFGFYEFLKVDSKIKKQQTEERYVETRQEPAHYQPPQTPAPQTVPVLEKPALKQPVSTQPVLQQQVANKPQLRPVKPSLSQNTPTKPQKPRQAKPVSKPVTQPIVKTAPKPASIAPGKLKLRSSPAARIQINGKSYGTTVDRTSSSNWIELKPGKHEIRLTREGYKDHRQKVTIVSGNELFLPLIRLINQAPSIDVKKPEKAVDPNKDVSFQALYSLIIETNQLPLKVYIKPLSGSGKARSFTLKKGAKSLEFPAGKYRVETSWNGQRKKRDITLPGPAGSKNITYFVSH